ncbi:hypothetical protein ACIPSJ_34340 [Streptomyces sp. NPDC090088]|uniref:hypothetical protein n=1 Tax=Streptomyces sp. NPDC090088 TaxID=3365944 RepID=UPI0038285B65
MRQAATVRPWPPVRPLTRLSRRPGTAEDAARDPALPERVVRRIAEALATAARVTA